jgi:glucose/arabinose dehydrogenase
MSWLETSTFGDLGGAGIVADRLSFPSSLAFDDEGTAYVAETGLPFAGASPGGRVWRVESGGTRTLVAGDLGYPVTGLVFHDGSLWVSQGSNPGRISRLELDGSITHVVDGLPGGGNYHTNEVAFGPDGKMYWGQGAMTNTGLVGLDALTMGWLKKLPHSIDIPGYDIELAGVAVTTADPFSTDSGATRTTGAYTQFGERLPAGTRIKGRGVATSAIHRANPDGTDLELVAWGIRNAFGLGFLPDGRLLAMDQGADDRGSRPVANVPDYLWEVRPGAWYGWPDYMGGQEITHARFTPETGPKPDFILANHHELPPPQTPLVEFSSHTAATKFDLDPASDGTVLVSALFGDETPMTAAAGHPTVGRALVLVRTTDWRQHILLTPELERPIDVAFHPVDGSLWVLDFGAFEMKAKDGGVTVDAVKDSGAILRYDKLPAFPEGDCPGR